MPYCQMATAPEPLQVARTDGVHIELADGRRLIDGCASWWTACHGYNHPHIRSSVEAQLEKMPHVMLGGLVHEPVLELAVRDVGLSERGGSLVVDPSLVGQRGEGRQGGPLAQVLVAAADDQLPGLGEELDLADAALAELEVMAGDSNRPGQALVGADAAAHVLGVLDGGEVEVAAPDEGAQALEEALAGGNRAGAGAGLDVGGALPGAADALVVVLGRVGGDADRCHRGVGSQPQVDPEDVALGGDLGEELDQVLRDPDGPAAELGIVVRIVAALVEEHDQVDIGRVVELAGAELAHADDRQTRVARRIIGMSQTERPGG